MNIKKTILPYACVGVTTLSACSGSIPLTIESALVEFEDPALHSCLIDTAERYSWNFVYEVILLDCTDGEYASISSTIGLEQLTALKSLTLGFDEFNSIDLSQNTDLLYLDLYYNKELRDIDFRNNPNLTILSLTALPMTTLDLRKNPKLIDLSLFEVPITTLDLSHNPDLVILTLDSNPPNNINVENKLYLLNGLEHSGTAQTK